MRLHSFLPRKPDAGAGPGVCRSGHPAPALWMEMTGSPKFLGNPLVLCPALRPRQDRRHLAIRCPGAAPVTETTKAPATSIISRLNRPASALAVYASPAGSPQHDARLASGCWPGSAGRACTRRVPTKGFELFLHLILLSQACLAQLNPFARSSMSRRHPRDNGFAGTCLTGLEPCFLPRPGAQRFGPSMLYKGARITIHTLFATKC